MGTLRKSLLISVLIPVLIGACDCGGGDPLTTRSGRAKVDPTTLEFGEVTVGASEVRVASIENVGNYFLQIERMSVTEPEVFNVAQGLPDRLDPSVRATVAVVFDPPRAGPFEGTLVIETDDDQGRHEVRLVGTGVIPPDPPPSCQLSVAPPAVQYPPVQLGRSADESVVVTNASEGDCTIGRLEVTGAGAPDFTLLAANPGSLAPGAQATIPVRFTRSVAQDRAAVLELESNDATTPVHRIPLLVGETRPGLCVMPTAIHFGVITGSATRDITVTACGDHAVDITAVDFTIASPEISLASPPAVPLVLAAGETRLITVQYAPSDQGDDRAVLTIRSSDPLVPSVDVEITGSPDIVPPDVGRLLYFWQVDASSRSNILRVPLQGGGAAAPYWGQSTGQAGCPGCHQVSRDGRYVAVIEFGLFFTMYVVDTMTDTKVTLPLELRLATSVSWRPDVSGSPPYRFVASVNGDLRLGSIGGGYLGTLAGADGSDYEAMPAWGPDGEIVYVRGQPDPLSPAPGFTGATDLMIIPENGGTPETLPGASGNGFGSVYPAYSPNGRWISFTESRSGGPTYAAADAQVRIVAADRSGTVHSLPMINGSNGATSFPTWSRDGSYLSISSNRTNGVGDWDIYIAPIDQTTGMELGAPTNLSTANTPGFEHAAQWSP